MKPADPKGRAVRFNPKPVGPAAKREAQSEYLLNKIYPTELLTRKQVSRRIKFSEHTIRKWVKLKVTGFPQPIRCGPQREHRWRAGDIEMWINAQERHPAPKRLRGRLAKARS